MIEQLINPREITIFITKEYKKGHLFVKEEYLPNLPHSWFDAVQFLLYYGIDQNNDKSLLILDDAETKRFLEYLDKDQIKLYVLLLNQEKNDKPNKIWNVLLQKIKEDGSEVERYFVGEKNLKNYCDDNNVFYKCFENSKGSLSYVSNLLYLKDPNDDCAKPVNISE